MIVMTVFPFCRTIQGHLYIFYVEYSFNGGCFVGKLFRIRIKGEKKNRKLYWVGRLCSEKYIPKRRQ